MAIQLINNGDSASIVREILNGNAVELNTTKLALDGDGSALTNLSKSQVGLSNVPNLDTTTAVSQTHTHANKSILDEVSGTNTGDETATTIRSKIGAATSSNNGYLSSTDWSTFNSKEDALGYTPDHIISVASPLVRSVNSVSITKATGSVDGYLSSTDWSTFNGKQDTLGYTAESVANKSSNTSLGTSNVLYPTVGAVKTYIDTVATTKQDSLGYTPVNKAGDTMTGDLTVPSISTTGQSATKAAQNITGGTKKTIPANYDFESFNNNLVFTDSGNNRKEFSGILYRSFSESPAITSEGSLIHRVATGTITIGAASKNITGVNTLFLSEFSVGDYLQIGTQYHKVASITSDTSMTTVWNNTTAVSGVTFLKVGSVIKAGGWRKDKFLHMYMSGLFTSGNNSTATLAIVAHLINPISGAQSDITISSVNESFVNSRTNYSYKKDIVVGCRSYGTSGTLYGRGDSLVQDGAAGQAAWVPINTTGLASATMDLVNNDTIIDVEFTWTANPATIRTNTFIETYC